MIHDYITVAIEAARSAGALLLDCKHKGYSISKKSDNSLVTEIDKKSENLITQILAGAFPGHSIMGEEGSGDNGKQGGDFLWIIDPIDGTHNYIRNIPLYGICIGLVHDLDFVGGVIYLPETDELYAAEQKAGAFKNGKRIGVSSCARMDEACLAYDSTFRGIAKQKTDVLAILGEATFNVRMFGSSAQSLSCLAEGKIDIVVEFDDKPWDFAAGAAIVMEAGGFFTDFYGKKANYKTIGYVGSNKLIHDKAISLIGAR